MALTFIDLFCGAGFGARGAHNAGAEPVIAVDSWELATKTYQDNFQSAKVLNKKIEDIEKEDIELLRFELEQEGQELPQVLLTSPECTAHSIARGSKPGCEISRASVNHIIPWVEVFNPRWVIVENVNRMKQWEGHSQLLKELETCGYKVNDLFLNAADFGVPQKRKRMFLVCDKDGTVVSKADLLETSGKSWKSARSILEKDTNRYKSTPLRKSSRAEATKERANRAICALGKNRDFLIAYYGSDYAGGWQSLDDPLRTVTTLDRFGLVTWVDGTEYLRMLQPTELLEAMGAKDHNLTFGTRREKVKLCGNGVCSPVLEAIFNQLNVLSSKLAKAS